jgi:predicted metal-dependent hydrolase
MAQKTFEIEGVGLVIVSKRRGSKNIRLSVNSRGQVRVNLPPWTPYAVGVAFVQSRKDWLAKHARVNPAIELKDQDRVGKSYRLKFEAKPGTKTLSTRLKQNQIIINIPNGTKPADIQASAIRASEKALRVEAEALLPQRLKLLADRHSFSYKSLQIKKLTGRWGSCSSSAQITLSYYLMQLPWQLIDYVLIHELIHTRYLNHGPQFWSEFKAIAPNARQLQKQIKQYKPVIQATI